VDSDLTTIMKVNQFEKFFLDKAISALAIHDLRRMA